MQFLDLLNKNADRECYTAALKWLENKNRGIKLADYFQENGYGSIAVWGASDLGYLLYLELEGTDITVEYFIDRNAEGLHEINGKRVVSTGAVSAMQEVEAMVVTPVWDYMAVCRYMLDINAGVGVISLRDILYEM